MKGARQFPQFNLRLDPSTRDAVEKSSKKSKRTINSEIAFRLEESLKKDGYLKEAA